MSYIELKNFSTYSVDNGFLKIEDIVGMDSVKQTGVAFLTDDSTLAGVPYFLDECKKNNVKPIIGATIHIKDKSQNTDAGTITLYAKDDEGFRNLSNIISSLDEDNLIEWKDISSNFNNLIVMDGGHGSCLDKIVSSGNAEASQKYVEFLKKYFNEDLYFEYQNQKLPNGNNETIKNLSSDNNVKLVSTNNNRFLKQNHYPLFLQKAMKSNLGKNKTKKNSHLIEDFVRTEKQNLNLYFKGGYFENQDIVNKIGEYNHIFKNEPNIPKTGDKTLKEIIQNKYKTFLNKYDPEKREKYKEVIKEELGIINETGFADYFLIFNEIIERSNNKNGFSLRGSSISSLIVHLIGLTNIDPVEHNLLFERFLNTKRSSRQELPDIDLDTIDPDEVFAILKDIYGEKNVALLATFSTFRTRSALDMSLKTIKEMHFSDDPNMDTIKKSYGFKEMPDVEKAVNIIKSKINNLGIEHADKTLSELEEVKEVKDYLKNYTAKKIYEMAKVFEGQISGISRSSSSVVIANEAISNFYSTKKASGVSIDYYVEADKKYIEKLGLVKLDILSNVVLKNTLEAYKGLKLPFKKTEETYEDENVFKMLSGNHIETLYQIKNQKKLCSKIGLHNFGDLVLVNAVLRPGADKTVAFSNDYDEEALEKIVNKKDPIKSAVLDEILSESRGSIVYDEQIMLIAQKVAGLSKGDSDVFRSFMKKNRPDLLKEYEKPFIEGAKKNGLSDKDSKALFAELESMCGRFTFNRAHAVAYAQLMYKQALIKAYFPGEYIDYFVNTNDIMLKYLSEIEDRNIKIIPLNINRSSMEFKTLSNKNNKDEKAIIFSFKHVLGDSDFTRAILTEREENGNYKSFFNYVERALERYSGKSLFDSFWYSDIDTRASFIQHSIRLIDSGAFDSLAPNELKDDIVNYRYTLKNSLNAAIQIATSPFSQEDYVYQTPEQKPVNKIAIDEENMIYGFSFLEENSIKNKLENKQKKNTFSPKRK